MNTQTITEPAETPAFLVDSRANLIIEAGSTTLRLVPADALELLKFLERTSYQAHATATNKGATTK